MVISVENAHRTFGRTTALDEVSFQVEPGEFVGFLGPNGAGKTTMMRILSGYLGADRGTVEICGYDMESSSLEARRHLGYMPEQVGVYEDMTPVRYLHYRAKLKEVPRSERNEQVESVLERCSLEDVRRKPTGYLSKGYRKRLGLADALLGSVDVLLLDEPTEGLDPGQVEETRNVLESIMEETDTTLFLSTHMLSEVERICERILILSDGSLRADRPIDGKRGEGAEFLLEMSGDRNEILSILRAIPPITDVRVTGERPDSVRYRVSSDEDVRADIYRECRSHDWLLLGMESVDQNLENLYMEVIDQG